MAWTGAGVLVGAVLWAGFTQAATSPLVGPIPAWVRQSPTAPMEKDDLKGLPVAILLNDTQYSFDAAGWSEFHEAIAKVQSTAGLQSLGAIPFQWSPGSDTLTFHRASILREGQSIDVLPKDGAFTVLRRETGLEQAMLTGELTALLQPEGLQVGDMLEIAVSIRHQDTLFGGRAGALLTGWDGVPVSHLRLEAHWPSTLPVRWRETADLPPLRRSAALGQTSVALELDDVHPPVPPAHAPPRFQHGRQVEFSTFADWREVAQLMSPLYLKAAELTPQSPVAAQARIIAGASADPKMRASAALRLVQGEVRYLAHVEASGGYTPQAADETWRLRYGDCKAKTVLLLALLNELHVPAEPVLVSTTGGDGLDRDLPSAAAFNHVLIKVSLGQRDYWLDGTRQGDRDLDELVTPAYGWVLPLGTTDSQLTRLIPTPPVRPQFSQFIRYDATGGKAAPEPTVLKTVIRGDAAVLIHAQLSAVPPERIDAALKDYWARVHSAFTAAHVAAAWDAAAGEEILTADGMSKLDWTDAGLELQHVAMGGAPDIKRDPASNDLDAPYVVDFPNYVETEETVVLPAGAAVSSQNLKTVAVDTTIAGVAYRRTAEIIGHVFRVVASQRALQTEISATEARASVDPLTQLGARAVYVSLGQPGTAVAAAVLDSHPSTFDGHLDRGEALVEAGRFDEAIGECDLAIALDPRSQRAWATRAVAEAWLSNSGRCRRRRQGRRAGAVVDRRRASPWSAGEPYRRSARRCRRVSQGPFTGARRRLQPAEPRRARSARG